jgi:DNA-directed RNA polymerase specialized sigma subunit
MAFLDLDADDGDVLDSTKIQEPDTPELELTGSGSFFDAMSKYRDNEKSSRGYSSGAISNTKPTDMSLVSQYRRNPNPKLGSQLLEQLTPHIKSAVYAHTKSDSPVLLGQGKLLAMRAISKYDGRSSIQTFIHSQLMPLKRQAAAQATGVKIPRSVPQDKRKLNAAFDDLTDRLGREPSFAELADHSGISLKRIHQINKINLPMLSDTEFSGDDDSVMTAGDQAIDDKAQIWEKTVYHGLDPINQYIMQHTTGLYGAKIMPNEKIAKYLNISPAAVSQRKSKIDAMLDNR